MHYTGRDFEGEPCTANSSADNGGLDSFYRSLISLCQRRRSCGPFSRSFPNSQYCQHAEEAAEHVDADVKEVVRV